MSLQIGDRAPLFDVTASDGKRIRLEDFRGKKVVVLYFYPKDGTRVCTLEACGFRDMYEDLMGKDTEIIGVSVDNDRSHKEFAEEHRVPFPLVADPERRLVKLYGTNSGLVGLLGISQRITYVIDKQGNIAGIFDAFRSADTHLDGVRATIDKLHKDSA